MIGRDRDQLPATTQGGTGGNSREHRHGQPRPPYLLTSVRGSRLYSSIMFTADTVSHPLDRSRCFYIEQSRPAELPGPRPRRCPPRAGLCRGARPPLPTLRPNAAVTCGDGGAVGGPFSQKSTFLKE